MPPGRWLPSCRCQGKPLMPSCLRVRAQRPSCVLRYSLTLTKTHLKLPSLGVWWGWRTPFLVLQVGDSEAQDLHSNTEAGDKTSPKSAQACHLHCPHSQRSPEPPFGSGAQCSLVPQQPLGQWADGCQREHSVSRHSPNSEEGRQCRSTLLSSADCGLVQAVFGSGDWGPLSWLTSR